MKKTYMMSSSEVKREWMLVDLANQPLGRVSTHIANLLMGKNKANYTPHIDSGNYVVAINASQIKLSGAKLTDKYYARHSGQPGGFKSVTAKEQMEKDPRKVIEHAVRGMVPKNKLQEPRLRHLKVYAGSEHPHTDNISKGK